MSPEALLSQLWENTLRASVLIVLVGLLRPWLRPLIGPRCFQWIWVIVVVRFLLPVDLTSTWSAENLVPTSVSSAPLIPARLDFANDVPTSQPIAVSSEEDLPVSWSFGDMVFTVWIIGVLGILAMVAVSHAVFWRRVRRDAQEADEPLSGLITDLAKSLSIHPIPVLQTSAVTSPAVAGLFRPQILLPRDMVSRVSPQELRLILLHELGHLKRHDLWKHFFMLLAVAVHWFNPFAWLALRFAREDSELACDTFVLDSTPQTLADTYDQTLLHLLTLSRSNKTAITTLGILENTKQIEHRMKMIHSYKPTTTTRALMSISLVLATGLAFLTNRVEAKSDSVGEGLIKIEFRTLAIRESDSLPQLGNSPSTLSSEDFKSLCNALKERSNNFWGWPDLVVVPGHPATLSTMVDFTLPGQNVSGDAKGQKIQTGSHGAIVDLTASKANLDKVHIEFTVKGRSIFGWSATPDGKTPVPFDAKVPSYPIYANSQESHELSTKNGRWTAVRLSDIAKADEGNFKVWLLVRADSEFGDKNRVAAVVNGRSLLESQVAELAKTYLKNENDASSSLVAETNQTAINNLIDRELVLQDFERRGFTIDQKAVDFAVSEIAKDEFGGDQAALRAAVEKQGFTWDDFLEIERQKIIVAAMRQFITRGETDPKVRDAKEKEWLRSLRDAASIQIIKDA